MRGTGSHDFAVTDAFVPATHTAPGVRRGTGATWHALSSSADEPVHPGARLRHSGHRPRRDRGPHRACLGQDTARFPDAATRIPQRAVDGGTRRGPGSAARAVVIEAVHSLWHEAETADPVSLRERAGIRIACTYCAEACAQAVDLVHAASGGSAIQESGRIARCFRDIHTATLHFGLSRVSTNEWSCAAGMDPGTLRF